MCSNCLKKFVFLGSIISLTSLSSIFQLYWHQQSSTSRSVNTLTKQFNAIATTTTNVRHTTRFQSIGKRSSNWFKKLKQKVCTSNIRLELQSSAFFSFQVKYAMFDSNGMQSNVENTSVKKNSGVVTIAVGAALIQNIKIKINSPLQKWGSLKNFLTFVPNYTHIVPTSLFFLITASGKKNNPKVMFEANYRNRGYSQSSTTVLGQFVVYNFNYNFSNFMKTRYGKIIFWTALTAAVVIIGSVIGTIAKNIFSYTSFLRCGKAIGQGLEESALKSAIEQQRNSIISAEKELSNLTNKKLVQEEDSVVASNSLDDLHARTHEGEDLSTDGEDLSTDGEDLSTDGDDLITDGDDLITDGDDLSTDGDDLSTDGDDLSTDGDDLSTDGDDLSTDGEDLNTALPNQITNGKEEREEVAANTSDQGHTSRHEDNSSVNIFLGSAKDIQESNLANKESPLLTLKPRARKETPRFWLYDYIPKKMRLRDFSFTAGQDYQMGQNTELTREQILELNSRKVSVLKNAVSIRNTIISNADTLDTYVEDIEDACQKLEIELKQIENIHPYSADKINDWIDYIESSTTLYHIW